MIGKGYGNKNGNTVLHIIAATGDDSLMKTKAKSNDEQEIGEQKRRIYGELAVYRKKHGVGCFKALSEATGGKVAVHTISHMYMGTRVNSDVWLLVGEALNKLRDDETSQ